MRKKWVCETLRPRKSFCQLVMLAVDWTTVQAVSSNPAMASAHYLTVIKSGLLSKHPIKNQDGNVFQTDHMHNMSNWWWINYIFYHSCGPSTM